MKKTTIIHKKDSNISISHQFIMTAIGMLFLFCESIIILLSLLKYGIRKKEILSRNSRYGFDFKIIMKQ